VLTAPGSLAVDDQVPLLHEQFVVISQRRLSRRKLKLINAALARLDRGDFGMCEQCGEGIPLRRLTNPSLGSFLRRLPRTIGSGDVFLRARSLVDRVGVP
jgi:hypothetical protein